MKKYLIIGGIITIAFVIFGFIIPPPNGLFRSGEVISDKVIYDPLSVYPWESKLGAEDISKRDYTTKDYATSDPTKRVSVQSLGLLHYYDGSFKDLQGLPFPEGKEITEQADRHFMMNLPKWCDTRIEENGNQAMCYDKKGMPIYVFKDPIAVNKNKGLYTTTLIEHPASISASWIELKQIENETDKGTFVVENNKLYVKLPTTLKNSYPLLVYDDTNTSSTNNKDAYMYAKNPDTNYNGTTLAVFSLITSGPNYSARTIIHFTLSSGSGTISSVNLYLYEMDVNATAGTGEVHQLTPDRVWTEAGATWNTYDGTNAWTTAGGDYSATIIDSIAFPAALNWVNFVLMGTGADNPLTLTWGDHADLLLKLNNENPGSWTGPYFWSKEYAVDTSLRPYLLITYTVAAAPEVKKVLPPIIIEEM